jgi:hypothetical protein
MSSRKYIILFLLSFLFKSIQCQDTTSVYTSHLISLTFGSNRLKEEILIPKVHSGALTGFSYVFEKSGNNFNSIACSFSYNHLKTKLETEKVTQTGLIDIKYSWGYNLLKSKGSNYFLGVTTSYNWSIQEFPVWDESRAYWGTSLAAGPYGRLSMTFDNQCSWISSFDISLLGILSRPEDVRLYAQEEWTISNIMKITNSDFSFGIMNNILICCFKSEYRIPFKNDSFLSFYGSMFYESVSESEGQPFKVSQIAAGIGFGF